MGGPIERSNRDILEAQLAALETLLVSGTGLRYQMFGPTIMGVSGTGEFGATLLDIYGNVVADADITPGTWTLRRSRGGVVSAIETGEASQVVAGGVLAQHTFSAADWAEGDVFYFEFNGVVVDEYEFPALYRMGSISAATVEGKVDLLLVDTAAIIAAVGVVDGKADDILTAVGALGTEDIAGVQAGVDAVKTVVDAVKAKTDGLVFTGTDVKATLDGETVALATNGLTAARVNADAVTKIQAGIREQTDKLAFTGTDVKATLDGETVVLTDGSLTAAKVATDAFGANQVSAAAVTKIQNGLATPAAVEASLNAAVANTPTAKSLRDILNKNTSGTYSRATDSLEAIRDRLDAALGSGWSDETLVALGAMLERLDRLAAGGQYTTLKTAGYSFEHYDTDPIFSYSIEEGGSYSEIVGLTGATVRHPVEIVSAVMVPTGAPLADVNVTVTLQYKDGANQWKDVLGWTQTWLYADINNRRALMLDVPPIAAMGFDSYAIRALRFKFTPHAEAGSTCSWYTQTVLRHRLALS